MTPDDANSASVLRFHLYSVEELESLPDPEWLIDGIVPKAGLVELYGQSEGGKSFLALDWALSIAAGHQWLGRSLKRADTVYISAEGGGGIKKRIAAWKSRHDDAKLGGFRAILQAAIMSDSVVVAALVKEIRKTNLVPGLIVVDTLARCFGDGDENSAKDMGRFVKGVDDLKGEFEGTTILVVHHTGKNPKNGERGSSALRGAADAVMELVVRNGKFLTLECKKQKDWEHFDAIPLRLRGVKLTGKETSCVIASYKGLDGVPQGEPEGQKNDDQALKALRGLGTAGATFTDWKNASALPSSTFKKVRKRLVGGGQVRRKGKLYHVARAQKGQGQGHAKSEPRAQAA